MGERLYVERFVWFDNEIRNGHYPNATRLAASFEISTKTAQRTIDFLRDRFSAPLEYDSSKKGYRYLDAGFSLPFIRLKEDELTALLASRKLLDDAASGPIGEELGKVSAKLGALLEQNLYGPADPGRAFSFRWNGFSPGDPLVFRQLVNALLHRRPISFCYYSPLSRACTMRTVDPHHMVNYMGSWHLIAFCRLRGEWRDFHLSRVTLCKLEDETFSSRPDQEWRPFLEDTFGIFQNREHFEVVLRFSPERSRWIRDQVWHPEQRMEETEQGGTLLTLPVSHEAEILMEILKHGSHVEIIEPAWLRKKVAEEIERMGRIYGPAREWGPEGEGER